MNMANKLGKVTSTMKEGNIVHGGRLLTYSWQVFGLDGFKIGLDTRVFLCIVRSFVWLNVLGEPPPKEVIHLPDFIMLPFFKG